jgi:hypothetical protein
VTAEGAEVMKGFDLRSSIEHAMLARRHGVGAGRALVLASLHAAHAGAVRNRMRRAKAWGASRPRLHATLAARGPGGLMRGK